MKKRNYKADLYVANMELAQLLDEREQVEIEIAKKRYRIAALLALAEENEEIYHEVGVNLGGLTDAVLTAFRSAFPKKLTPVAVKDRLANLGFPIEHYRNAMAAIHTVIGRLADARKIVPAKTETGEAAHTYHSPRGLTIERFDASSRFRSERFDASNRFRSLKRDKE